MSIQSSVPYIFIAAAITMLVSGLRAIFFGYKILLYLRRHYPDKAKKLAFHFRGTAQLYKERDIQDPEFLRLRKKLRNSQNLAALAALFAVVFVLFIVFIAFLFGQ